MPPVKMIRGTKFSRHLVGPIFLFFIYIYFRITSVSYFHITSCSKANKKKNSYDISNNISIIIIAFIATFELLRHFQGQQGAIPNYNHLKLLIRAV